MSVCLIIMHLQSVKRLDFFKSTLSSLSGIYSTDTEIGVHTPSLHGKGISKDLNGSCAICHEPVAPRNGLSDTLDWIQQTAMFNLRTFQLVVVLSNCALNTLSTWKDWIRDICRATFHNPNQFINSNFVIQITNAPDNSGIRRRDQRGCSLLMSRYKEVHLRSVSS